MAKYNQNQLNFISKLMDKGVKSNAATKAMCLKFDIRYTNNVRDYFKKLISSGCEIKEKVAKVTPKVSEDFVLSAWKDDGSVMNIDEYCAHYKLSLKDIKSWRLGDRRGVPYYQMSFRTVINTHVDVDDAIDYSFIQELVKKHIKQIPLSDKKVVLSKTFDRIVYTDVHIGMSTNKEGIALYATPWNKETLNKQLDEMIGFTIENKKSNTLYIDELGDYLDGWDGYTTRGGHKLPQNMTNQEAFDVAVSFKVKLADMLVNHYDYIQMNNICEDNHAGSFGYVVNSAVKSILELKYKGQVHINNMVQFMNTYYVGGHGFVLTHGKDAKSLKFGFKPFLDPKQIEKIDQYLKQYGVYKNSKWIEFSKGDSHQFLIDKCSSDDFDYCNYMAFSPSSEWVQTNFKKGRRGFSFQTIHFDKNIKTTTEVWFNDDI